jgi:citrate lyase alpha subunit
MKAQRLQGLIESVKGGDTAAADRLTYLLRPVVSHRVRHVVQTQDFATPLGRHVQEVVDEEGTLCQPDSPVAVDLITQTICSRTVARLRTEGHRAQGVLETVLA